jgi:hypothetical protein
MKSVITIEIDYHPGVGLGRVEQLLQLATTQYGVRGATITVDDSTLIQRNRQQLSLERQARKRRETARQRRSPTNRKRNR